jgi:cytochrome c556
MNRRLIFIMAWIAVIVIEVTAVAQQHRAYNLIMKDVGPTFQSLKKNLDGNNGAAAAADAAKLQGLFTEAEAFWAPFDTKDAVGFAQRARDAAGAVAAAAKGNDMKAAQESYAKIQKSCANCHFAHREETAKGFLIRP